MGKRQEAASVLHSLIALNKCAIGISEYLRRYEVHTTLKHRLKIFEYHLKNLHTDITLHMPETDRSIFNHEFTNRDIEVYASVFSMMANLTDEEREFIEKYISNYAKQESDALQQS